MTTSDCVFSTAFCIPEFEFSYSKVYLIFPSKSLLRHTLLYSVPRIFRKLTHFQLCESVAESANHLYPALGMHWNDVFKICVRMESMHLGPSTTYNNATQAPCLPRFLTRLDLLLLFQSAVPLYTHSSTTYLNQLTRIKPIQVFFTDFSNHHGRTTQKVQSLCLQ